MKDFFVRYKDVLATLLAFAIFLTPVLAGAAGSFPTSGTGSGAPTTGTGSGGSGQRVVGSNSLTNPLNPLNNGIDSVCDLVIALVRAAIAIGIPIAVLFIVWAGLKFILARGNPGKIGEAQKNLLNVVIGIAIFLASSLIANVIVNTLHQLGVQGINSC
jgi:hypothetical protein